MKSRMFHQYIILFLTVVMFDSCVEQTSATQSVQGEQIAWLTTLDATKRFELTEGLFKDLNPDAAIEIDIDPTKRYQTMDGFGYTLTGGSAKLLQQMSKDKRAVLLKHLFAVGGQSIGVSYLRVSIGASDLDPEVFSYNDIPEGTADMGLEKFSLGKDREYLIPVLKQILALNPNLSIMASPWSPPVWMKTNGASMGGSLKSDCFSVYANYFIRYINGMHAEGITIDAVTIQNEPLHPGNNPSLYMSWEDQARFVRDYLGPQFESANLKTKIILYDHNADHTEYPIHIMDDPTVKKYVDGAAFHLYGGQANDIAKVHEAHPDKNLYFTEQWIGAPGDYSSDIKWHIENLFIGTSRSWCKVILEWNLAADPNLEPHTEGGCTQCLGALTIDGDEVTYNPAYYIVAHSSKYIRPGSLRVSSTHQDTLPNVAYLTPNNQLVLLVVNNQNHTVSFNVNEKGGGFSSQLPAGAVATYIWDASLRASDGI